MNQFPPGYPPGCPIDWAEMWAKTHAGFIAAVDGNFVTSFSGQTIKARIVGWATSYLGTQLVMLELSTAHTFPRNPNPPSAMGLVHGYVVDDPDENRIFYSDCDYPNIVAIAVAQKCDRHGMPVPSAPPGRATSASLASVDLGLGKMEMVVSVVPPSADLSHFPHTCRQCQAPAWVSPIFGNIDCSNPTCSNFKKNAV